MQCDLASKMALVRALSKVPVDQNREAQLIPSYLLHLCRGFCGPAGQPELPLAWARPHPCPDARSPTQCRPIPGPVGLQVSFLEGTVCGPALGGKLFWG